MSPRTARRVLVVAGLAAVTAQTVALGWAWLVSDDPSERDRGT